MGPPNQPPNGFKIGANFKQICQNVKNRDFSVFGAFLDLDNRTGARFGCLFFLIVHPCLVAFGWFFSWSANLVSADAEAADDGAAAALDGFSPGPPILSLLMLRLLMMVSSPCVLDGIRHHRWAGNCPLSPNLTSDLPTWAKKGPNGPRKGTRENP